MGLTTENQDVAEEVIEVPLTPGTVSVLDVASAVRYLATKLSPVENKTFQEMFPTLYGKEK